MENEMNYDMASQYQHYCKQPSYYCYMFPSYNPISEKNYDMASQYQHYYKQPSYYCYLLPCYNQRSLSLFTIKTKIRMKT